MKRFIKKLFKKYDSSVRTGVIGSYSFYDDFLIKHDCKEYINNELIPSILPKVEYNENDIDRKSAYHQYYIKMVILKKFVEILNNEIDRTQHWLKYPEHSYSRTGPRD